MLDKTKWTREAFLNSLPRHCLGCMRQGVIYTDRDLVREEKYGQSILAMQMVAICCRPDCGAVYAQQPASGPRIGPGYRYGREEIRLVTHLPFHVPLGGRVSEILDKGDFVLPGRRYACVVAVASL